jgi:anti-sigma factor RsiW
MNCESVQELLPLYTSGELTGEALAAVQFHIHACESCRQALSADRELDDALRTAMLEDSPDVSAVLLRVHAGMVPAGWKRMLHLPSWRAIALVATTVLAAVLGLSMFYARQGQRTAALIHPEIPHLRHRTRVVLESNRSAMTLLVPFPRSSHPHFVPADIQAAPPSSTAPTSVVEEQNALGILALPDSIQVRRCQKLRKSPRERRYIVCRFFR